LQTLDPAPPPSGTDAPDAVTGLPALGDHVARLMAAKLIARGDTSQAVREYAAARPQYACMWDAVANAMDAITAVPAPRLAADPSAWDLDPETERHVARLYLTRLTPDQLRSHVAAGRCEPEYRPMFTGIARQMDALLAEGFDPAVFAEEIRASAAAAA